MKLKISNIILIVLIVFLTLFLIFFDINYFKTDKYAFNSDKQEEKGTKFIALLYEMMYQSGEYQTSTGFTWPSTGFVFNSSLSKCENGSTLTYDSVTNGIKVHSIKSDMCFVYFDKGKPKFSDFLIENSNTLGMYFHNSSLVNGANDNSYRFSGANPNNYVCFGPGATPARTTCPEENQYRIIGVFGDQVKLIKKTSLGHRQWDNKGQYGDNTWSTSLINAYLNGEYLNNLTTTWSNKIATTTWQVGGMTLANGSRAVPATAYNYELGTNKVNVTFN
ncbi:MAG: DUF6273 domain-containing protein, partial [Bacilli bacterium]